MHGWENMGHICPPLKGGVMIEIWPGDPYPLGATYDGAGTNFALFSEAAERVELCLFDDDGSRDRVALTEVDGVRLARLPAGRRRRASGTATACTVRTTRRTGSGATRPSCCSTRTPRRSRAGRRGTRRCTATASASPTRATTSTRRPFMPALRRDQPVLRLGHDRPPRTPYHDTVIYEAHVQGPDHAATRRSPSELRGTYAALGHPEIIDHLTELGVTAVELMPVHQFVTDHVLVERGLTNYWGYNTHRLLRPAQRATPPRAARRAGAGVQGDGAGAARGEHRGHPRRGLQPHRRGQPPGSDAELPGHRQRRLLPAGRRTTSATTWTPRAPATACSCAPRTCFR